MKSIWCGLDGSCIILSRSKLTFLLTTCAASLLESAEHKATPPRHAGDERPAVMHARGSWLSAIPAHERQRFFLTADEARQQLDQYFDAEDVSGGGEL